MGDVTFYNNLYFGVLIYIFLVTAGMLLSSKKQYNELVNSSAILIVLALVIIIGTYPVFEDWGDRHAYSVKFKELKESKYLDFNINNVFELYMYICSVVMSFKVWLLLTASIYVGSAFYFTKKLSRNHFLLFIAVVSNFVFLSYGYNTIRAGLASSILLFSFLNLNKKFKFYLLLLTAIGMHYSMLIPAIAIFISRNIKNTKIYLKFWLICLGLSWFIGPSIQSLLSNLVESERLNHYLILKNSNYSQGFRFDFLIYSVFPILLGYYYIFKKKYTDHLYLLFYNSYVFSNAIWVLVIRANFSDRFAYLSWFLYVFVVLYPVLDSLFIKRQYKIVFYFILINCIFTYYMFLK